MNRILKFACPYRQQGCSRRFRSQGGRTYHIRTCHTNHNYITSPLSPESHERISSEPVSPSSDPPASDLDIPIPSEEQDPNVSHSPSLSHPSQLEAQALQKKHPSLTGDFFFSPVILSFLTYNL